MKFGPVPVAAAEGAILAHAVTTPAGKLRKGIQLSSSDVRVLKDAGIVDVIVAQLGPEDLIEDAAASRLADAIMGAHLRRTKAATGRVNLYATQPGVASVAANAIAAFNTVNPMITVATVPEFHRVAVGTMVATIKIISYAVATEDVDRAAKAAPKALSVLPPQFATATLIETEIGQPHSTKGRNALAARLDRLNLTLGPPVSVPHEVEALSGAIAQAEGEVVFILTGSATSDIDDVGPAALRRAGGSVTQFGMPVDPGNLLFLGKLGNKPVIGLPGCARSPALNGADWVLERVICGVDLSSADFAGMGVGGLLKEIPTRGLPVP